MVDWGTALVEVAISLMFYAPLAYLIWASGQVEMMGSMARERGHWWFGRNATGQWRVDE